jgi:hypothetical protein
MAKSDRPKALEINVADELTVHESIGIGLRACVRRLPEHPPGSEAITISDLLRRCTGPASNQGGRFRSPSRRR